MYFDKLLFTCIGLLALRIAALRGPGGHPHKYGVAYHVRENLTEPSTYSSRPPEEHVRILVRNLRKREANGNAGNKAEQRIVAATKKTEKTTKGSLKKGNGVAGGGEGDACPLTRKDIDGPLGAGTPSNAKPNTGNPGARKPKAARPNIAKPNIAKPRAGKPKVQAIRARGLVSMPGVKLTTSLLIHNCSFPRHAFQLQNAKKFPLVQKSNSYSKNLRKMSEGLKRGAYQSQTLVPATTTYER